MIIVYKMFCPIWIMQIRGLNFVYYLIKCAPHCTLLTSTFFKKTLERRHKMRKQGGPYWTWTFFCMALLHCEFKWTHSRICRPNLRCHEQIINLTYWSREIMTTISVTLLSNYISGMEFYAFSYKFHWSLPLMALLKTSKHLFKWWPVAPFTNMV